MVIPERRERRTNWYPTVFLILVTVLLMVTLHLFFKLLIIHSLDGKISDRSSHLKRLREEQPPNGHLKLDCEKEARIVIHLVKAVMEAVHGKQKPRSGINTGSDLTHLRLVNQSGINNTGSEPSNLSFVPRSGVNIGGDSHPMNTEPESGSGDYKQKDYNFTLLQPFPSQRVSQDENETHSIRSDLQHLLRVRRDVLNGSETNTRKLANQSDPFNGSEPNPNQRGTSNGSESKPMQPNNQRDPINGSEPNPNQRGTSNGSESKPKQPTNQSGKDPFNGSEPNPNQRDTSNGSESKPKQPNNQRDPFNGSEPNPNQKDALYRGPPSPIQPANQGGTLNGSEPNTPQPSNQTGALNGSEANTPQPPSQTGALNGSEANATQQPNHTNVMDLEWSAQSQNLTAAGHLRIGRIVNETGGGKYPKPMRIRRRASGREDRKQKNDFWVRYAGDASTSCKVPKQGLKTAEILCKIWPSSIACNAYCVYGSTYPEGIVRTLNCSFEKNRWSDYFEECQPFVNCKLRLVGPGSLKCIDNRVRQSPSCQIGCAAYEDHEGFAPRMYDCKTDGTWEPALPPCVHKKDRIDLARAPQIRNHASVNYPNTKAGR